MKQLKKIRIIIMAAVILSLAAPVLAPCMPGSATAYAAAAKINKRKLTLVVKKTAALKITGTKSKVTWTSSNSKVASVGKTTGKVTAKSSGKATITGKVGSKKYTCKVTVIPFDVKKETINNITGQVPKKWISDSGEVESSGVKLEQIVAMPDQKKKDIITLSVIETKTEAPDIDTVLDFEKQVVTAANQQAAVEQYFGVTGLKVTDIKFTKYKASIGDLVKITYNVKKGSNLYSKVICYEGNIDNYRINATAFDTLDKTAPSIPAAVKYLIDSLLIK